MIQSHDRNPSSRPGIRQIDRAASAQVRDVQGNVPPGNIPTEVALTAPVLLRLPMVVRTTGLAKSTIYLLVAREQFPAPIKLSRRAVAWLQSEVAQWVMDRTSCRDQRA